MTIEIPRDYTATITVPVSTDIARQAIFDQMHLWWTHRVDREKDGVTVRFGNSHARFVFEGAGGLDWRCTEAHMLIEDVPHADEWTGTRLLWRIKPAGQETQITLTHEGLNASLDCLDVCTRGWQHFFETSLRDFLSGKPPAPETR